MEQQQPQYPMNQIYAQQPLEQQPYLPPLQPQYPPLPLQTQQPLSLPYPPQYPSNPFQYHHHQQPIPTHYPHQPYNPMIPQYSLHLSYDTSYPPPHIQAQPQLHHNRPSKRPRDPPSDVCAGGVESGVDDPSAKRMKGQDVLFRVVLPSRQIGKVIGKHGSRIQKIREDTKANIKISDALARYEERVIIISSKNNGDGITDAEKALHQIAELILKEDGNSLEALSVVGATTIDTTSSNGSVGGIDVAGSLGVIDGTPVVHLVPNAIRILIAGSQAGSLIGVSGQNIEKLRNSSGASITVLAPNQLPYCASAHESDRLVQISGEKSAVIKAVEEIGCQLRENPAKQVVSISPAYNLTTTRAVPQYIDPNAAEYVTLDMVISETMVGGLIGRCGSNISRIRNESGAMIKVHGGKGVQKHRQIQLAGTAEQVALARQRVDEYIYSQLIQQADGQQ